MATKDKSNNKNLRALFSVICLCIIALGLIVYFSTQSANTTKVNEATTLAQTTEVQKRVTVKQTTTKAVSQRQTTAKVTSAKSSSTKAATTEKATMQAGDTNIPYKSFYKYPCQETVAAGYSEELVKNETMGDYRAHTAVDFKCSAGEKVVAVNDGLVLSVTRDSMLGSIVEIDHGSKLVARYCGLDSISVKKGDYVTIGQAIGTVGTVPFESSDDSHLHFETRLDGKLVNPLDVMGKSE